MHGPIAEVERREQLYRSIDALAGEGDSLADLAEDYDTSTQNIEEAIRCELTRREAA